MANTTYVFSAYPDGSTVTSTCSFKATPTNKKGNIIKNSTKGVKLGSTDVKAIYKGDIQIWPEVKTLYFVNIQIYTQTEYKGTSGDPHSAIVDPLLSGDEFSGNSSEPGWSDMNNYSGSDFIQGKRRRGSMWEVVNTFGTFKYREYTRNYFVCDIQDTTYSPFNVGSSKIDIPFSSINIKWEADDGTVTSINTSTTRFSFEAWCYMQGTKFYYSPGWVANISSRINGGIKRAGGFELPEKPENVIIHRGLPAANFVKKSGSNNAILSNQTINGTSGRNVLKNYAKSFGFEYKDPYYASSPYTSYALYHNGTYVPYRYIFKGCSWNPSSVSYNITRTIRCTFDTTGAWVGNTIVPNSRRDVYQKMYLHGSIAGNLIGDTFSDIYIYKGSHPSDREIWDYRELGWQYNANASNYPTLLTGNSRMANTNGDFSGVIGMSSTTINPDFSYEIHNNRARSTYTFTSNRAAVSPTSMSANSWIYMGKLNHSISPNTRDSTVTVNYSIPFTFYCNAQLGRDRVGFESDAGFVINLRIKVNNTKLTSRSYLLHRNGATDSDDMYGRPMPDSGNWTVSGWSDHWGDGYRDHNDITSNGWTWPEHTISGSFYFNTSSWDYTSVSSISIEIYYLVLNRHANSDIFWWEDYNNPFGGWSGSDTFSSGMTVSFAQSSMTIKLTNYTWGTISLGNTYSKLNYNSNYWSSPYHPCAVINYDQVSSKKIKFDSTIAAENGSIPVTTGTINNCYYDIDEYNDTYLAVGYVGIYRNSVSDSAVEGHRSIHYYPLTTKRFVSQVERNYTLK